MAYAHEKNNLNDRSVLEKAINTWVDVQAEFQQQSSTLLSEKLSTIALGVTGGKISKNVDSVITIISSNPHMALAWGCASMMPNVAAVCSISCCNFTRKMELSLCSSITPIWPKSCWRA